MPSSEYLLNAMYSSKRSVSKLHPKTSAQFNQTQSPPEQIQCKPMLLNDFGDYAQRFQLE